MLQAPSPALHAQVVLPPLPREMRAVIQQHNQQALHLLVMAVAEHLLRSCPHSQDTAVGQLTLPLSRLCFNAACHGCPDVAAPRPEPLHSGSSPGDRSGAAYGLLPLLRRLAIPSLVCAPFAALSGAGDMFASLPELLACLPQSLSHLYESGLPLLTTTDWNGRPLALNAYVLDYYTHGQKRALVSVHVVGSTAVAYRQGGIAGALDLPLMQSG
jgi:hypothetical protein